MKGMEITIAPYNVDFLAISLAATIIAPLNNPFETIANQFMSWNYDSHPMKNSY